MTLNETDDHNGNEGATVRDTFATQLIAAMERKGWSQAQTAQAVRDRLPPGGTFSPGNLSHYVSGRSRPSPKFRQALMEALEFEIAPGEQRRTRRSRQTRRAAIAKQHRGETLQRGADLIRIEDQGDTVRLEICTSLPWPAALEVLKAIKEQSPS